MKTQTLDEILEQLCGRLSKRILATEGIEFGEREFDVMLLLGGGLGNEEIAAELKIGVGSVANVVLALRNRTGMNRTRLALYGAILGITAKSA